MFYTTGFQTFASPFLLLLAILFLVLPIFLILMRHLDDVADSVSQFINMMVVRASHVAGVIYKPFQIFADKMKNKEAVENNKSIPCLSAESLLCWLLMKSIIMAIWCSCMFCCFILIFWGLILMALHRVLWISSKAVVMEVGHPDTTDEENKNALFNESIFFEIVFESVPQLLICIVNQRALNGGYGYLFILQVVSSGVILIRELVPIVISILNEKSFTGGMIKIRRVFGSPEDMVGEVEVVASERF